MKKGAGTSKRLQGFCQWEKCYELATHITHKRGYLRCDKHAAKHHIKIEVVS